MERLRNFLEGTDWFLVFVAFVFVAGLVAQIAGLGDSGGFGP